jgi:hypothetical protein
MPSLKLANLRNKIVQEMIFDLATKLKQKNHTMHLAVKIFDMVSITQTDIECPRNEVRNLKFLAAQCLLLASKFLEV